MRYYVNTEAFGVCHTDLHAARGDRLLKPALPFIPNHAGIGLVAAVGASVTSVKEGDLGGLPWFSTGQVFDRLEHGEVAARVILNCAGN